MHALFGNGAPQTMATRTGRGKGKGKGKWKASNVDTATPYTARVPTDAPYIYQDTHTEVRNAVQMVLPEAARLRAQTCLVSREWSVPIQY